MAAWLGAAGCVAADRPQGAPGEHNAAPHAVIAFGGEYALGTTVVLDGSGSSDPEGGPLRYRWVLQAGPGAAELVDTGEPEVELVLDELGSYLVTLRVTDDRGLEDSATVEVISGGPVVAVEVSDDVVTLIGQTIALAGSASTTPEQPLTYTWSLAQRPEGSAAVIADPGATATSFVPDVPGLYVAELTARTDAGALGRGFVQVSAMLPQVELTGVALAAEYAASLDRLVVTSTSPSRVRLIDPVTGAEDVVALAEPPTALSLEPGGLRAAIGHDGNVSIVDLQDLSVTVLDVTTSVHDVVFDAGGRVHAFPVTAGQFADVHTVEVATNVETLSTGGQVLDGTNARLNPVRPTTLYGVPAGVGVNVLERYDLSGASLSLGTDYSEFSDAICGDVWITADGASVITACGGVFRSTTDPATDLDYRATLSSLRLASVDHLPDRDEVWSLGLPSSGLTGGRILVHDDQSFAKLQDRPMPPVYLDGGLKAMRPIFLAHRADSSELYLLGRVGARDVVVRFAP